MLAFPPRRRLHIEVGRIGHTDTSQSTFRLIWFHDIPKNYRKVRTVRLPSNHLASQLPHGTDRQSYKSTRGRRHSKRRYASSRYDSNVMVGDNSIVMVVLGRGRGRWAVCRICTNSGVFCCTGDWPVSRARRSKGTKGSRKINCCTLSDELWRSLFRVLEVLGSIQ